MESAPTVCQSRCILLAANFGGVGAPRPTSYRKGERRAASSLAAVPASGHSKPSVQSPHPHPADKSLPCQREVPSLRGGGFLPVRGCDSAQGIARQNPSGRLRRPPAPLLALRATSPGTGESVFDKGGFSAPTLNFTSNSTLAKSGKVCYNLIAYRFSGKYSRNPNPKKRRVPPHVRTPVGNPCGFLW